jgi:hypothetical protein
MSEGKWADVERALFEFAKDPGDGAPEPRHARRLLVALGLAAIEAEGAWPAELAGRVNARLAARREAWERAIARDLELAVWEFDTSVDPRYLPRPDYDHGYTREARERIDARLVALDLLDLDFPESLGEKLSAADARYEPYAGA